MHPIRYTKDDKGKICFYYDKAEYRDWYKRDGGLILVSIDGKYFSHYMMQNGIRFTINSVNLPIFDGEIQPPEYYLKPQAVKRAEDFWGKLKIGLLNFPK